MTNPAIAGSLCTSEIRGVSEQVFTDGFPLPQALHDPALKKPRAVRVRRRINALSTTVIAIAPESGGGVEITVSDGVTRFGNTRRAVGKLTVHGATPDQVREFLAVTIDALDKAAANLNLK